MLQVEGEGAPHLGVWDFIAEHFRRKDLTATTSDTSNRRFGGDAAAWIPSLGARFYYVLIFEDIRKARWIDAVRYDADHLFGIAIPNVRAHLGFMAEYSQTGVRSQEHTPRTTGFTSGGYAVGDPLGPDAKSLYAASQIDLGHVTLVPSLEFAQLRSDKYTFVVDGPITPIEAGPRENRYRTALQVRIPVRPDAWAQADVQFERVTGFAFDPAANRNNAGVSLSMVWYPGSVIGTLNKH